MATHIQQHQRCLLLFLLLLQLLLLVASLSTAAKVPAVIVFGDSTVDAGNNNHISTIARSNFIPYGRDFYGGRPTGRFCNGRIATDFISEALGLRPFIPAYLDPAYTIKDFATGVCFASAASGLDNATSDVLTVIPLWKEVEYFKEYQKKLSRYMGRQKAKQTVGEAVYIVSIGTNDFLENYYTFLTGRSNQFNNDVGQFEDFIVGLAAEFLTAIYRLGARKISFTSLSPIGCLPMERTSNFMGGGCNEDYNKVARDFNAKMQVMEQELCATLPGLRLRYADVYYPMLHLIENPHLYGFENSDVGCCATGRYEMGYLCNQWNPFTCPDAGKFVFWDAFHPTERVNRIMAEFALNGSLTGFH